MAQYVEVNGHLVEFPDGMAAPEIEAAIKKNIMSLPTSGAPANLLKGEGYDKIANYSGKDALGGLARGAGSIGSTLLAPIDAAARFVNSGKPINIGGYDIAGQDRRQGMDAGLDSAGVDRESSAFQTNKLGAEIAGTAGIGGLLAKGILAIPGAAKALPSLLPAIQSGGMLAGGAPGAYGMAARTAGGAVSGAATAGLVNPDDAGTGAMIGGALPGALKAAAATGSAIKQAAGASAKNILGTMAGVGGEAVGTAYQAGKAGGTNFLDNMRGNVPMTDVLDSAKEALSKMRVDRGNSYRSGMLDISGDKSIIPFGPIDKAVAALQSTGNFKGQVINKNAAGTVNEISDLVSQWKGLNPAEYHTPEGLDALKKAIGDIQQSLPYNTPSRNVADKAYNAVKDQITAQAPTYAKVMGEYSQASNMLKEIEKSLSINPKASVDSRSA